MRTLKRLTPYLLAGAALFAAACGDDDGNNKADAAPIPTFDAAVDAAPIVPTRSGTIALTNVVVTTPAAAALGIAGPAISIAFEDLTMGGGTVKVNTGTPGCQVVAYDCPAGKCPFHPPVDVGPVTLGNVAAGTPGITGIVPDACTFNATTKAYECPIAAAGATNRAVNLSASGGLGHLTDATHTFDTKLRGTAVRLTGLPAALVALEGKLVPVVSAGVNAAGDAAAPAELHVALPPALTIPATDLTGVNYAFVQGNGPVPGGLKPPAVDWLADADMAAEEISIKLTGSAENRYPAGIDQKITPGGGGFELQAAGTACPRCVKPHELPKTVPADEPAFSFGCEAAKCGGAGKPLSGFAVSGSASNGTAPANPFEMPTDGTKFVSFSCSALSAKIDIPKAVLAAILEIQPTRIETRVFRIGAPLPPTDPTTKNEYRILGAHGFVGHTSLP